MRFSSPLIEWAIFRWMPVVIKNNVIKCIQKVQVGSCQLRVLVRAPGNRLLWNSSRSGTAGSSPYCSDCHIIKAIIFQSFPGGLRCPPRQLQPAARCGMCQGKGSAPGGCVPDGHSRIAELSMSCAHLHMEFCKRGELPRNHLSFVEYLE